MAREPIEIQPEYLAELGRKILYNEDGNLMVISEKVLAESELKTISLTAKELAEILLTMSGQMAEQVQSEIDRLYSDKGGEDLSDLYRDLTYES